MDLSLIIWSIAALLSLLGAFCYMELGTTIHIPEADFAYLCYVSDGICFHVWSVVSLFIRRRLQFKLRQSAIGVFDDTNKFYFKKLTGKTQNLQNAFDKVQFKSDHTITVLFAALFSYEGWDVLNFGTKEIEKPKYLYAAARQGHLPNFLSCSNTEHNSPQVAIFISLINYVSFCQWLQRIFTILALLWIRFVRKPIHRYPESNHRAVIFMIISVSLVNMVFIYISNEQVSEEPVSIVQATIFLLLAIYIASNKVTTNVDFHICIIGASILLGAFAFYFLFFYKHSPAVQGIKTFGYIVKRLL
uniref:Uncharacterized protein n=1 Tax=Onchocerca volvulus TaxID=6282 RepID=A0A8R1TK54_ONCVO